MVRKDSWQPYIVRSKSPNRFQRKQRLSSHIRAASNGRSENRSSKGQLALDEVREEPGPACPPGRNKGGQESKAPGCRVQGDTLYAYTQQDMDEETCLLLRTPQNSAGALYTCNCTPTPQQNCSHYPSPTAPILPGILSLESTTCCPSRSEPRIEKPRNLPRRPALHPPSFPLQLQNWDCSGTISTLIQTRPVKVSGIHLLQERMTPQGNGSSLPTYMLPILPSYKLTNPPNPHQPPKQGPWKAHTEYKAVSIKKKKKKKGCLCTSIIPSLRRLMYYCHECEASLLYILNSRPV